MMLKMGIERILQTHRVDTNLDELEKETHELAMPYMNGHSVANSECLRRMYAKYGAMYELTMPEVKKNVERYSVYLNKFYK